MHRGAHVIMNTAHKMELFVIQDFQEMKRWNPEGMGWGAWGMGGGEVGVERAPYTPKYLDQFLTVLLETFTTGIIFV